MILQVRYQEKYRSLIRNTKKILKLNIHKIISKYSQIKMFVQEEILAEQQII